MINYFETGQVELKFGCGDIIVGLLGYKGDDFAYVTFNQVDKHYTIGEPTTDAKDLPPDIIMAFDKVESIDVVIKRLQSARDYLASKGKEENGGD